MECQVEEMEKDIQNAWKDCILQLQEGGAKIVPVSIQSLPLALPAYFIIACAEASSNLSRYDGLRYGYNSLKINKDLLNLNKFSKFNEDSNHLNNKIINSSFNAEEEKIISNILQNLKEEEEILRQRSDTLNMSTKDNNENQALLLHKLITQNRSLGFGPEVQRRILSGSYVLSASAFAVFYAKALAIRQRLSQEFNNLFHSNHSLITKLQELQNSSTLKTAQMEENDKVDVLLTPTSPVGPFISSDGELITDSISLLTSDVMTTPISLAGLPAVSIPVATSASVHLPDITVPIGMQIVGGFGREDKMFYVAKYLEEQVTFDELREDFNRKNR